jgi:hypothetical protein
MAVRANFELRACFDGLRNRIEDLRSRFDEQGGGLAE